MSKCFVPQHFSASLNNSDYNNPVLLQPVGQLADSVVQQQSWLLGLQSRLLGFESRLPQLHQLQRHLRRPAVRAARRRRGAARPPPALPAAAGGHVQRLLHVHPRPPEQGQALPRHAAVSGLALVPLLAVLAVAPQLAHGHPLPLGPSGLPAHPDDGGVHGAGGPRAAGGAAGPAAGRRRLRAPAGQQESPRGRSPPGGLHLHR